MNRELKRMLQLAGGLLAGALVIINLGALFQRPPAGTTVTLGPQRGRRLYQLHGNHASTNGSWLTAGPTAYLAAFQSRPPAGSVQVSDPDATWLVHHLPAGTRLVVK